VAANTTAPPTASAATVPPWCVATRSQCPCRSVRVTVILRATRLGGGAHGRHAREAISEEEIDSAWSEASRAHVAHRRSDHLQLWIERHGWIRAVDQDIRGERGGHRADARLQRGHDDIERVQDAVAPRVNPSGVPTRTIAAVPANLPIRSRIRLAV